MSTADPPATNLPPSPSQAAPSIYERLAPWYDLLSLPERPIRQRALTLLSLGPGERVLVVGSGTGQDLAEAARRGAAAVGVDLAPAMCRRARARLHRARLAERAMPLCADALLLPLARASCDAALLVFSLELFAPAEMGRLLVAIAHVVRPDGRLVVTCLSRRRVTPIVRLYEWAHNRWPLQIDCRPIHAIPLLEAGGWRVVRTEEANVWGLPVDIVRASPPSRAGSAR